MAVGTNTIAEHRLRIDMSEKIAELEPNASPLITLTKKMKRRRVVTNPEFNWMEQDPGNRWDAINKSAGYDNSATVWQLTMLAIFGLEILCRSQAQLKLCWLPLLIIQRMP